MNRNVQTKSTIVKLPLLLFSTLCNAPKVEKFCAEAGKGDADDGASVGCTAVLLRNALSALSLQRKVSETPSLLLRFVPSVLVVKWCVCSLPASYPVSSACTVNACWVGFFFVCLFFSMC